ncbi:MAG: ABC-F family ATP-binding cassette domain-containing protein [Deltaproteobacteria bacterium]|nr:ABC-F family ATP-binding cassette domain-containing protein [Deltaproteobacteria bacterium]
MSLAQFADVSFGYPGKEILEGASLLIRPGDRLALLGPNGTGKSTVLKLLAGSLIPDAGDVRVLGRFTVAYLQQSQQLSGDGTVLDALLEPFAHLHEMHDEMLRLETRLGAAEPAELKRYGELQERYRIEGGYDIESRVRDLVLEVGLTRGDLGRDLATLSGGERGRLELAKVLARQPDLLLLDEPTNHLDLDAIERLEARLGEYPGAFVLVSHDRTFVQRTCREIIEIEDAKFVRYAYPYDQYVVERDARLERARIEYERQKEHVEKTEAFIRKNLAGQNTKQAQSRRRMLAKLERLERPEDNWQLAGKIALKFSSGGDLGGKEIIRAPNISVGYPDRPILENVTVNIYRGDRVGIVGPNGCGKSTLAKTLVGELPPLAGTVERGAGVRLGYFDQKLSTLQEGRTAIEEIQSVRNDLSPEVVRSYLARFRFFGDDPFRTVRGFSGGERSRLALAKMLLFPRNVLVMDEPTNHLDIPARETLEHALDDFDGTLLVVSHDRYFLDRICRRLLVFTEEGLRGHTGNYSDWREHQRRRDASAQPEAAAAPPPRLTQSSTEAIRLAKKERERQQRRLERLVASLEEEISRVEGELATLRAKLGQDHGGDWKKLHELADQERDLDAVLGKRMADWEKASAELQAFLATE